MSINLFDNIENGQDIDFLIKQKGKPIKINDTDVVALISNINNELDSKKIITKSDLRQGDLIYYNNKKWINVKQSNDKRYGVYNKSVMRLANTVVKFIDENNKIHEFNSFIDSGTMDVATSQYITVADGEIYCTLQSNSNSNKLKLDNRFIKFGTAWKITGIDKTCEGLIKLHAKQDLINTVVDDMTNEVANAFSNVYSISIVEGDSLTMNVGDTTTLHAVITLNGSAVTKPITWSSNDSNIATIDNLGNLKCVSTGSCIITATLADNNDIKDTINITVNLIAPISYSVVIDGLDKIKCMTSTITNGVNYNAKLLKNGTEMPCKFDFTLDFNGYDTKIATMKIIDDNNVKIYVNNKGLYTNSKKPLKLKAVNSTDSTQFITKDIQVVSIMG